MLCVLHLAAAISLCPAVLRAEDRRGQGGKPGKGEAVAPPGAAAPESELARAKLAYERGDYRAAIGALRPLLYPAATLSDEQQVVLGHKLLGLSYFFEHDEAGAEQEFNLLLSLRPDFALDPLLEPQQAVAFADSLRRKNQERLGEIRRRQSDEELRRKAQEAEQRRLTEARLRQSAQRIYFERVVKRRLSPLSFVPFGVPQLAAGRRRLGVLLAVSEGVLGAASLSTYITVRLRYPDGTFVASPRELTI